MQRRSDWVRISERHIYSYDQLLDVCRAKHIDLLVAEEHFEESCPKFETCWKQNFEKVRPHFMDEDGEVIELLRFVSAE